MTPNSVAAALGGGLALALGTPLEAIAARFTAGDAGTWLLATVFIGLLSLPVIWALSFE